MKPKKVKPPFYGFLAEFEKAEDLVHAARKTYAEGYRKIDAYSPFPVHGLAESIGFHKTRLPLLVLAGGILGAFGGYFMEYYASAVSYPLNIGGRPFHSWPSFIPVAFETTILLAAIFTVMGMFALNGLPMPYHPVFNVPQFELASRDRFFLCIRAVDPQFETEKTKRFLETFKPVGVHLVEH